MNLFNKTEAIGIFVSIAIMAIALLLIRFKTDVFTLANTAEQQVAAVVSVSDQDTNTQRISAQGGSLEDKITNAMSADGTVTELIIDDIRVGEGTVAAEGDTVTVHYVGTMPDGTRFDSSYDRGEPFTFTLGEGKVIQGWEQGVLGMMEGGERVLVVPSDLAYGNRSVGPIKPNSTLVFTIKLLSVTSSS